MTIAEFTFLDNKDLEHKILYKLIDSPLTQRWIDLININKSRPDNTLSGVFSNRTVNDVQKLTDDINQLVTNINQEYHIQLPIYEQLDNKKLNYLHEFFELFVKDSNIYSDSLKLNFNDLNETIHCCEHAMFNRGDNLGVFGLTFDMYPRNNFDSIIEEDKLMLRSELLWGKIYLGYNTLGKDWLQCIKFNDIDVILRNSVAPQRRFAAETWINFGADFESGYWLTEFYRRVKLLPVEIQKLIPLDNLNELTLGRFILGDIIITDEFLKIDSNRNNWLINNHECKRKWTYEVFSTFRTVNNFRLL